MKLTRLFFFSLFLLPFLAQGQAVTKTVTATHENGKPKEIHFYRGENVIKNLTEVQHFADNGTQTLQEEYYKGEKHGKQTIWNIFGVMTEQAMWKNGKLYGTYEKYNGEMENKLLESLNYIDGEMEGSQKYYDLEGNIVKEVTYKDGKLNGKQREWHSPEQLKKEFNFANGLPHMKQNEWDESGQVVQSLNFVLGKLSGTQIWNQNGKKVSEDWLNGTWEKVTSTWPSGNPRMREYFYYDMEPITPELEIEGLKRRSKTATYHENGSISSQQIFGDEAEYKAWHTNGKVAVEGKGTQETPLGEWNWYYPNGTKQKSGIYTDGQEEGQWRMWNEEGKQSASMTYNAGKRTDWKVFFYHKNGTLKAEGELDELGNKSGTWLYRYEDGRKMREETYAPGSGTGARPVLQKVNAFYQDGKKWVEGDEKSVNIFTYYEEGNKKSRTKAKLEGRSKFRWEFFDEKTGQMELNGGDASTIRSSRVTNILNGPAVILEEAFWFPDEKQERIDRYNEAGVREGVQEGWYDTGKQKYVYTLNSNGNPEGSIKEWYADGSPRLELTYESSVTGTELASGTFYNEKGKDYFYSKADGDKMKSKMQEILETSYLTTFLQQ